MSVFRAAFRPVSSLLIWIQEELLNFQSVQFFTCCSSGSFHSELTCKTRALLDFFSPLEGYIVEKLPDGCQSPVSTLSGVGGQGRPSSSFFFCFCAVLRKVWSKNPPKTKQNKTKTLPEKSRGSDWVILCVPVSLWNARCERGLTCLLVHVLPAAGVSPL